MPNTVDKTKMAVSAPGAFARIGGQPLDYTSIFNSYDDMVKYAADPDGQAYVGQLITLEVSGSPAELYVVRSSSLGKHTVSSVAYDIYVEKVKQGDSVPAFDNYEDIVKNAYDNRDNYAAGQLFVHTAENTVYSFTSTSCGTITVDYGGTHKNIEVYVIPVAYKAPVFESWEDLVKFSESEKGSRLAYTLAIVKDTSSNRLKAYCITANSYGSVTIDGKEHFNYTIPMSQPLAFESYDALVVFASRANNHFTRDFAIVTAPYPSLYYIDTTKAGEHTVNGTKYDVYVHLVRAGTRTFDTYVDLVDFSSTAEGRASVGSYAIVAEPKLPPRMYVITKDLCNSFIDDSNTSHLNYTAPATPTLTFSDRDNLIVYAAKPENRLFPTIAMVGTSSPQLYYIMQTSSDKVTVNGTEYDNYTLPAYSNKDFPVQNTSYEQVPVVSAKDGSVYGVRLTTAVWANSIPMLDSKARLSASTQADLTSGAHIPTKAHVERMITALQTSLENNSVKVGSAKNADNATTATTLVHSAYTPFSTDSSTLHDFGITALAGTALLIIFQDGEGHWHTGTIVLGLRSNAYYKPGVGSIMQSSNDGRVRFNIISYDYGESGYADDKVYGWLYSNNTDARYMMFKILTGEVFEITNGKPSGA